MNLPTIPAARRFSSRVTAHRLAARPGACRRSQHGVALIEALISILIFSFGVLGIMGLEARAINISVESEDRNRAALFASEVASSMWLAGNVVVPGAPYAALLAGISNPAATGLPNGVITVTPVPGTTNAADIVITWKSPSRTASEDSSVLTTRVILP